MSASLGGILKDYRLQRNIPQLEIAFALGWKDTSRLSRIEQGIVEKPPRELIDHICKAMNLTEQEKNFLLLTGNYLPTKEEIDQVRKDTGDYLEQWPYPAVLFDFGSRNIMINSKIARLLGMSKADTEKFHEDMPTIIELLFHPEFSQNKYLTGSEITDWHNNLVRMLIHFKGIQKSILSDKWYSGVIKRMMHNDLFRELWKKAQTAQEDFITTRYGSKPFVHPEDTGKRLNFNFFIVPLLKDPRFELEFFNPADTVTADFFLKNQ